MLSPKKLADWLVDRPRLTVTVVLLGILFSLWRIEELHIDASTRGMINESDPQKQVYETFKNRFGSDILTAVVLTPPEGDVFNLETIALVDTLTEAIWDLDGVSSVESLTTVRNIKSDDDVLITDELIEFMPETAEDLEQIRADALASPLITGNVVSPDGLHTAINVFTANEDDPDYDKRFLEALDGIMAEHKGQHQWFQVGAPRYNVTFNAFIKRDQMTLVPLSVLIIMVVFLSMFRGLIGVVLPCVTSGLSIAAMAGFMAWMDFSLSAVSVMAPSVLIVVGCTEDVHLIAKYVANLRETAGDKVAAIRLTMQNSLLGITLTSLTTMVGFGVLSLNEIKAIQEFGIITSFGLLANYIITVVVTPALFRLFKPPRERTLKKNQTTSNGILDRILAVVYRLNLGRPRLMGGLAVLLIVLAVMGFMRLEVNNDPIGFFKPDAQIRQDFKRLDREIAGGQVFHIMFSLAEDGDAKEPDFLARVARLEEHLATEGSFDKSLSLATFVKLMNRAMHDDPSQYEIPGDRNLIAQYLILLEGEDLDRFVTQGYDHTTVMVRHAMSGSQQVNEALIDLRGYLEANLSRYVKDGQIKPLRWQITGESILLHRGTDDLINGQMRSLAIALVVIFLIISALFLSFKAGAVAMVSNLIPILFNFGLMGWAGVPFNVGTCLVATIALGVAVDDTIHFMVRYNRALRRKHNQEKALEQALCHEGHPILITSMALTLGFSVLIASPFNPTMHFGILAALIMVYAVIADLLVNPLLLSRIQLITVWDYARLRISRTTLKEGLIFKDLKNREVRTFILMGALEEVAHGTEILRQDEEGQEMFLILEGLVEVSVRNEKEEQKTVTFLESGDLIGEMAMLGEGKRSATVTAMGEVSLLRIDDRALQRILRRNPQIAAKIFRNISRVLSERVKDQTQRNV